MLSKGADLTITNKRGMSAMDMAMESGHLHLVDLLNPTNNCGNTHCNSHSSSFSDENTLQISYDDNSYSNWKCCNSPLHTKMIFGKKNHSFLLFIYFPLSFWCLCTKKININYWMTKVMFARKILAWKRVLPLLIRLMQFWELRFPSDRQWLSIYLSNN